MQIVDAASSKTCRDDGQEERKVPEPELAPRRRQQQIVSRL
ncbi:MAG: hypothetical protein NT154_15545 [Verrucomicrobia bacterium]|nr:hypothetical protein [Verrucomicrobiota bacterium]